MSDDHGLYQAFANNYNLWNTDRAKTLRIPDLIEILRHRGKQEAADKIIAAQFDVALIRKYAENGDFIEHRIYTRMLGEIATPLAFGTLVSWQHKGCSLSSLAYRILMEKIGASGRCIIQGLTDADWYIRCRCAWILGLARHEPAEVVLIEALKDDEPGVRHFAAMALGKIGSRRAVPFIVALLFNDEDERAKVLYIKAIELIRCPEAIPVLRKLQQDVTDPALLHYLKQAIQSLERRRE